jgi:hypothetical protein
MMLNIKHHDNVIFFELSFFHLLLKRFFVEFTQLQWIGVLSIEVHPTH